jgi:hypothetical protein
MPASSNAQSPFAGFPLLRPQSAKSRFMLARSQTRRVWGWIIHCSAISWTAIFKLGFPQSSSKTLTRLNIFKVQHYDFTVKQILSPVIPLFIKCSFFGA